MSRSHLAFLRTRLCVRSDAPAVHSPATAFCRTAYQMLQSDYFSRDQNAQNIGRHLKRVMRHTPTDGSQFRDPPATGFGLRSRMQKRRLIQNLPQPPLHRWPAMPHRACLLGNKNPLTPDRRSAVPALGQGSLPLHMTLRIPSGWKACFVCDSSSKRPSPLRPIVGGKSFRKETQQRHSSKESESTTKHSLIEKSVSATDINGDTEATHNSLPSSIS